MGRCLDGPVCRLALWVPPSSKTLLPSKANADTFFLSGADGWMSKCKALSNGLGLISEGLELPLDKLPPIDPDKVQNLPMRWYTFSSFFRLDAAERVSCHRSRSLPSPERRP